MGGSSAGWVGLKLWTPPSYNSKGFLGWAPATPSFFAGALSGCLLVPLSTLSLCRHHAKISLWLWGIRWILRTAQKGAPEE